ncbi:lytic transglycosylase domain-containing protein [Aliikangiella marina]|uniref:Lytic transglycosylase domain-containing protein n=2 Tax=Aliikangiella marina TaxID=1712262 RepID=A0A545TEL0_9GAMM|nr:lytic transglycosylase domain-containing protein [Aliikangiella marina]
MLMTVMLFAFPAIAESNVYRFVNQNGDVEFTDRPKHDGFVRIVKTWKGWKPVKANPNFRANRKKYSPLIAEAAKEFDFPVEFIHAVIHAESHFDPYAVSSAGAMGLMQLMPATASRFGVNDRQNPRQNIYGGVRYLRYLSEMFDGNLTLTLAAYNAGENAVKRFGYKVPPYQETRRYIKKVNRFYSSYRNNYQQ